MWNMIAIGVYQCTECGDYLNAQRRATELPACVVCINNGTVQDGDMTEVTLILPSITELAKNYAEERKKWVEAGKPIRTDERILEIYTKRCDPCDFRREGRCGLCGCFIKPKGTLFNKIAWGTTKCPFKYMKLWGEETDPNNLRNATQEEIDAFETEKEFKVDEELKEQIENSPSPPSIEPDCGCG